MGPQLNLNPFSHSKIALYGHCNSIMALIPIEKSFARSLLPNDLELADQSLTDSDHHVALLHFNHNFLNFAWFPPRVNLDYHEFVFMLPYVKRSGAHVSDPTLYSFLPVLYLNSLIAVWGGRWWWEFNKLPAHCDVTDKLYTVTSPFLRAPLLQAVTEKVGPPMPSAGVPNFSAIAPILDMPFIENGLYGLVTANYRVHYQGLPLQPMRVEATSISCPYLPQMSHHVPPLSEAIFGAFQMDYKWDLNFVRFLR
jgi:hypothetical protein